MDTNEIGFYVNTRMGLCFNLNILTELLNQTRKFKNAVMVTYDTQNSNYGMNPLKAYRLSEKAIACFTAKEDYQLKGIMSSKAGNERIVPHLVQKKINTENLSI